jgi:hypothetical protein
MLIFCSRPYCRRYEVALKKESVNAGSFLKVEITQRFPLRPRAAIPSAGHLSSPIAASGIVDCVPMLFVTGCEWQLSFFQDNGMLLQRLLYGLLMTSDDHPNR